MEVVIFMSSHTQILLTLGNHTPGFSNETSLVFEFQAVLEINRNKLKVEGPDPYVKFTLVLQLFWEKISAFANPDNHSN